MCVSGLWIYWGTCGSLWDNMALERSAGPPAHCNIMPQFSSYLRPTLKKRPGPETSPKLLITRPYVSRSER